MQIEGSTCITSVHIQQLNLYLSTSYIQCALFDVIQALPDSTQH